MKSRLLEVKQNSNPGRWLKFAALKNLKPTEITSTSVDEAQINQHVIKKLWSTAGPLRISRNTLCSDYLKAVELLCIRVYLFLFSFLFSFCFPRQMRYPKKSLIWVVEWYIILKLSQAWYERQINTSIKSLSVKKTSLKFWFWAYFKLIRWACRL